MARLFMTAPGVGAVIALSVASTYEGRRLQEGKGRGGAQARRHPPRNWKTKEPFRYAAAAA
ncbi:hypothetical protein ACWTU6_28075 [Mesorhizobium sp. BHbsci]